MVDLKLAEGASLTATSAQVSKLEGMLKGHPGIRNYVAYVGTGSPRFYLPLDQQLPATSFAQFVLLADDIGSREQVRRWLIDTLATKFTDVNARVTRLENGPPVGYPVQFPDLRRTHRHGAQAGLADRRQGAREPERHQRESRLAGAEQGRAPCRRPGPRARARREFGPARGFPAQCPLRRTCVRTTARTRNSSKCCCAARRTSARNSHCSAASLCRAQTATCRCRRSRRSNTVSRKASSGTAIACQPSPCVATSMARPRRHQSPRRSNRPCSPSVRSCLQVTCSKPVAPSRIPRADRTR